MSNRPYPPKTGYAHTQEQQKLHHLNLKFWSWLWILDRLIRSSPKIRLPVTSLINMPFFVYYYFSFKPTKKRTSLSIIFSQLLFSFHIPRDPTKAFQTYNHTTETPIRLHLSKPLYLAQVLTI